MCKNCGVFVICASCVTRATLWDFQLARARRGIGVVDVQKLELFSRFLRCLRNLGWIGVAEVQKRGFVLRFLLLCGDSACRIALAMVPSRFARDPLRGLRVSDRSRCGPV